MDNFRPHLLKYFKPAFLGRTTVVPFYPLLAEDLMKIAKINMRKIEKRVRATYNADFTYDDDLLLHIVACSQNEDTGARNIENMLTRTILPELGTECLSRMAAGEDIQKIHVGCTEEGEFTYSVE